MLYKLNMNKVIKKSSTAEHYPEGIKETIHLALRLPKSSAILLEKHVETPNPLSFLDTPKITIVESPSSQKIE